MTPGSPNVVVIVLDDLGFGDLDCYGSRIETPRIAALAEGGLRYNNFHVTAVCSPTRACLMTGRNHHAVGMGFVANRPTELPGYCGRIPQSLAALPRVLRNAGYSTLAVGKWHLAPQIETGPAGPFDRWPLGMGFERYYGFLDCGTDQWAPNLVRDNSHVEQPTTAAEGYHLTEDMAQQAIRLIQDQQQAAPDKPFFLYFATGAPHAPHQAPRDWIDRYRGQFDDGWESLRQEIFDRQCELGVIPSNTVLADRPSWIASWDRLSAEERRLFSRQMETYAGFVTHTDAQIGRIVDFLGVTGALENTLILFLSDNGACAEGGPYGFLSLTGDNDIASMASRIDDIGGVRAWSLYGWGWAWAGNTPFRLWKRYSWLGGVRAPLIVHWPKGIDRDSWGEVRGQFCHAIDVMPSILDLAHVAVPETLDGVPQGPLDGRSIAPTLNDRESPSPRTTQYFEMLGSRAIYHEGWKATTDHINALVPAERELIPGSDDFDRDRWTLCCVDEDFSEARDLSAQHPDRLRRMVELWWDEAERNQVLPLMDDTPLPRAEPRVPNAVAQRYVYRRGGAPIVTPSLAGGFRVAAEIEVPDTEDLAGVICAQGDWYGGWACYVRQGELTAVFKFSRDPLRIVAAEPLLAGRREVVVEYVPGSQEAGAVALSIDGRMVASGSVVSDPDLLVTAPHLGKLRLSIGLDRGFPVCDEYDPPYEFCGKIARVTLTVPAVSRSNHSHREIENALRQD